MSSLPPIFDGMSLAMKNMSEKQRVIAENIANSDTPGFKARTVQSPDFSALVSQYGESGSTPQVTRPRVMLSSKMSSLGAKAPQAGGTVMLDPNTSETKPDGNNVTLEDQLLNLGQVQADYSAMTNLYRKQIGIMKSALGR